MSSAEAANLHLWMTPTQAIKAAKAIFEENGHNQVAAAVKVDELAGDVSLAMVAFDDDSSYESALVAICVYQHVAEAESDGDFKFDHWISRYFIEKGIDDRIAIAATAGLIRQYGLFFFQNNPVQVQLKMYNLGRALAKRRESLLADGGWMKRKDDVEQVRRILEFSVSRRAWLASTGVVAVALLAGTNYGVYEWQHQSTADVPVYESSVSEAQDVQGPEVLDMSSSAQNLSLRTQVFSWNDGGPSDDFSVSSTSYVQSTIAVPGETLQLDIVAMLVDPSDYSPERYSGLELLVNWDAKAEPLMDASYAYSESHPNGVALETPLGPEPTEVVLNSDGSNVAFRSSIRIDEPGRFSCGRTPVIVETWFRNERVSVMSPNIIYVDNNCSRQ
ncbi:hypothetical protein [Dietzia natronolimnaea]|uniref:hypothetical protein n=1 Tax=Dietzia natronolimnaea TaxID=161920 RepID=UPI0015F8E422|nr:hypothetical protein [Dietzia natronolimnaea]MBB1037343.1 hypothetical protein [Dietzia natronolimnaea]